MRKSGLLLALCLLPACNDRSIDGHPGSDMTGTLPDSGASDLAGASSFDLAAQRPLWQPEPSGTKQDLLGIWGSSANDIYVVGRGGTILHSHGEGQWTAQDSGTMGTISAIWGSSATDLYAVTTGFVLRSNGDGHWRTETPPNGNQGLDWGVWGTSATDVYICGIFGVAHSTGDGTWTLLPPSKDNRGYFSINGRGPNDIWAVGGDGQTKIGQLIGGAYHFTGSWSWIAFGSTQNMKSIAFTQKGAFVVGNGGQIWLDDGVGFQQQSSSQPNDLNSVWAASDGTLFAVGGSGTVTTSSGNGSWAPEPTPSALPLNGVWGANKSAIYAVGYAGEILRR